MNELSATRVAERVLILVPTPKDASTTEQILTDAGLFGQRCNTLEDLCSTAAAGAGAMLVTEEAILADERRCLANFIQAQPAWSDFPIVVLTRSGLDPAATFPHLTAIGNMTFITRPVQIAALVSALQAAIRDRQRQYRLRDYLVERERTEAELKDADRRKDEFLAMLAHELRNPLAAVQSAVSLLACDDIAAEEREWSLDVLQRQVSQLTRLIDDLLDVSRITRGKIELRTERVDVAVLIQEAVEVVTPLIKSLNHTLSVNSPPGESVWLEGDPARLEQVLVNLLTNAAKYTPAGGQIRLNAECTADTIQLQIADNGVGIPAEMLAKLFDVFFQIRESLDRSEGGLGIGLTIVKRLVELHGGKISVTSGGRGRGSEFTIRLPRVDAAERNHSGKSNVPKPIRSKRNVLIVDDNLDSAKALSLLLSKAGHNTRVAHNAEAALEVAEAFRPEIALLDIGLPGMDGYQLAGKLLQLESLSDTVLVAVSGYGQAEDRRRSIEAGFHHHFVKPVDQRELVALLADPAAKRN